ncbi:uncharacterized protein LOC133849275 [Drosophila sulfurigaster albostrigata]|uniref:uncharacterized protein LOC133849275 n=1 Tax=Drosophila sulfurigaster albostrigata TaxID=89887 RepID=UPI002D21D607|nr:uncharacterized protein LOC133849275 [Drosophila sulfurigaster albostrigata]
MAKWLSESTEMWLINMASVLLFIFDYNLIAQVYLPRDLVSTILVFDSLILMNMIRQKFMQASSNWFAFPICIVLVYLCNQFMFLCIWNPICYFAEYFKEHVLSNMQPMTPLKYGFYSYHLSYIVRSIISLLITIIIFKPQLYKRNSINNKAQADVHPLQ